MTGSRREAEEVDAGFERSREAVVPPLVAARERSGEKRA
jgi:hypothetical protein